jgi:hypothetical protein
MLAKAPEPFRAEARQFLGMDVGWTRSGPMKVKAKLWQPTVKALVVEGDLEVAGTLLVRTQEKADDTFLVVLGSVTCQNFVMGTGATFLCAGAVKVAEAMSCSAPDSVARVAGKVTATLLDSGSGAWLNVYDPAQVKRSVRHLTGYVMIGNRPLERKSADLTKVVKKAAIETEEWDNLDPEDRKEERMSDYLRLDAEAARKLLIAGKSILRLCTRSRRREGE